MEGKTWHTWTDLSNGHIDEHAIRTARVQ